MMDIFLQCKWDKKRREITKSKKSLDVIQKRMRPKEKRKETERERKRKMNTGI